MRDQIHLHEFLKTRWVACNNHLKHLLIRWNFQPEKPPGAKKAPGVYSEDGRRQILQAFPHLQRLYLVVDAIDQAMKESRKKIEEMGNAIPEVRRLQTVPGFGPLISLALYTEIGDVARFDRAERLVRYFGLDPVHGSSGDKHWDGHRISKKGVPFMRGLLAQGAWSHVSCCPESDITENFHRLVGRGKTKQQALMMVMRRLVKAAYWVLREEREFTIKGPARSTTCRTSVSAVGAALTSVDREAPTAVR